MTVNREDLLSAKEWLDFIDARQINHAWHVENSKTIRTVLEERLEQPDWKAISGEMFEKLILTHNVLQEQLIGDEGASFEEANHAYQESKKFISKYEQAIGGK